jgi:hypothetical protein
MLPLIRRGSIAMARADRALSVSDERRSVERALADAGEALARSRRGIERTRAIVASIEPPPPAPPLPMRPGKRGLFPFLEAFDPEPPR